jgi:hypothetical protein
LQRAWTTGFDSVEITMIATPSASSFRSPIPSPRQHRTVSDPSWETYTV